MKSRIIYKLFLRIRSFEIVSRSLHSLAMIWDPSSSPGAPVVTSVQSSWRSTPSARSTWLQPVLISFVQDNEILLQLSVEGSSCSTICRLQVLDAQHFSESRYRINESKRFVRPRVCRRSTCCSYVHHWSRRESGNVG